MPPKRRKSKGEDSAHSPKKTSKIDTRNHQKPRCQSGVGTNTSPGGAGQVAIGAGNLLGAPHPSLWAHTCRRYAVDPSSKCMTNVQAPYHGFLTLKVPVTRVVEILLQTNRPASIVGDKAPAETAAVGAGAGQAEEDTARPEASTAEIESYSITGVIDTTNTFGEGQCATPQLLLRAPTSLSLVTSEEQENVILQVLVSPATSVKRTAVSRPSVGGSNSVEVPFPDFRTSHTSDSIDVSTPRTVPEALPTASGMNMAPLNGAATVSARIKDVIQNLHDMQSMVHGYQPETQAPLYDKMIDLVGSLDEVKNLTDPSHPKSVAHTLQSVPPELVDYVDEGRNPDIYKREVVEAVQRGNAVVGGKMKAFEDFSQVFAAKLRKMDEGREAVGMDMDREVGRIMQRAGLEEGEVSEGERRNRGDGAEGDEARKNGEQRKL